MLKPKYQEYLLSSNLEKKITKIVLNKGFEISAELENAKQLDYELDKENIEFSKEKEKYLTKKEIEEFDRLKLFEYTSPRFSARTAPYHTNAYRKMYEICEKTQILINLENVNHFDICGLPGTFVFAVHEFIKINCPEKKYDFYIQSYVKDENDTNYFEDEYDLVKTYPSRFIYINKGDVTDLELINYYRTFFKDKKRNLVTSDCGLGKTTESREEQMTPTFLGQYLITISTLDKGGNYFCKYYNFYSPFNLSLIYLMCVQFENVYLIKPEFSRQFSGREIYFYCENFRGCNGSIIDDLLSILNYIKKIQIIYLRVFLNTIKWKKIYLKI